MERGDLLIQNAVVVSSKNMLQLFWQQAPERE